MFACPAHKTRPSESYPLIDNDQLMDNAGDISVFREMKCETRNGGNEAVRVLRGQAQASVTLRTARQGKLQPLINANACKRGIET
jgi:hypothetical protein